MLRKFGQEIKKPDVNKIDENIRVGNDDTNKRGSWWDILTPAGGRIAVRGHQFQSSQRVLVQSIG